MDLYKENLEATWHEIDAFTVERYTQFSQYIKYGQSVLDIGCNTGRGGATLKTLNPTVKLFGIELLKERIDMIPAAIYEEVFNESVITSTCNNNTFDAIIAGEVIEHISKDVFSDMLHNCKKLLKKDGLLLFTTPNPNCFLVKLGRNAVFDDPSHVNIMSVKELKSAVQSCGLKIKAIKGSGRTTRYLGDSFPLNLYGSYLSVIGK